MTQPTAVYTAREKMLMAQDTTISKFDVHLYMVNCVVALVIDSLGVPLPEMDVQLSGTATGFNVLDSTFTFEHPSILRATRLMDKCYAVVAWPSASDSVSTGLSQVKATTTEEKTYWEVRSYVKLPNGSVTETIFSMHKPLEAGTIVIIRANMEENGALDPLNTERNEVGVSVKLDWNDGGTHEIEI